MLKKSAASSRPNRTAPKKGDSNMRSSDTIKRLKMYNNGKAIRNKEGTVVGGQFMMNDRAGDRKITTSKYFFEFYEHYLHLCALHLIS
jgi:nuclear GTP-binding protein